LTWFPLFCAMVVSLVPFGSAAPSLSRRVVQGFLSRPVGAANDGPAPALTGFWSRP
jgi:hypothetical protein